MAMVCYGLIGHHASSIRLGDRDFSVALSLKSHQHLRISIIDCIVGEFPAVLQPFRSLSVPQLRYIPHRPLPYPAETTVVKLFQFRPVFFFQSPALICPECYIDNNRLIEPATDVYRDLLVAEHLPVHGAA
jgi:hypothetical protein